MNSYRKTRKVFICSIVVIGFLLFVVKDADADFIFGTPTNLGPTVNSTSNVQGPDISADGLELYFSEYQGAPFRLGGYGLSDIWVTTRPSKDDPWGTPVNLGPVVNSASNDEHPSISADGLSLYFGSNRYGGSGAEDLWVTTRETKGSPWGKPVNLGSVVNSTYPDWEPEISPDGLSLYFADYQNPRPGGHGGWDLYFTTRSTLSDPWNVPANLGPTLNSSGFDTGAVISADGLLFFLCSTRIGGFGGADLWMTTRKTRNAEWGSPVNLGSLVNTPGFEAMPSISSDGLTLYFCSERAGGFGSVDLWQVPIEPVVDFNGDGTVDSADLCIMIDYWGTNESLCDIGPMPWGDGIVDIQDMVVFAEYLLDETLPVDLVAHWKLDEVEGIYTKDSVSGNNAIVIGSPVSLPTGGMVDGALEFNGIMDCIITESVLNPEDGPFRVFAWINGGAPGQVVLSQSGGVNWLAIDASEGNLMTELAGPEPNSSPLQSQTIVTDSEWHLIGFVWDGSHRTLYVDNVAVAKDTQNGLKGSSMGLYIGTGKMMQPGTYFSGLIDDVRLYNRAVSPKPIDTLEQ